MKINILEDALEIGGNIIKPPFTDEKMKTVLGLPELCLENVRDSIFIYEWGKSGIGGRLNKNTGEYDTLIISLNDKGNTAIKNAVNENPLIKGNPINTCEWIVENGFACKLEIGCFSINTSIGKFIEKEWKRSPIFEMMSSRIEIAYKKPVQQKDEYALEELDVPVLHFDNFNFKLAVIKELMYNQELLKPKFDVDEFCKGYKKRMIDIEAEGYEPISEVIDWFEKLQIPASMADVVKEISMDGGDDINHQIIPYWDGEDDYFDLSALSKEEVSQFKNLKKIYAMTSDIDTLRDAVKGLTVDVELWA